MIKYLLLSVSLIASNVAIAQDWIGSSLTFLKSDGTIGGDNTYFKRFDEISDRVNLRLNLGDEYTSDFQIGYHHYNGSGWHSTFSLDGYGTGFFAGNLGVGTTSPFSGSSNSGIHISKGNHTSILIGDPIAQSFGGIIQTSDQRHRVFIGANLYDDQTYSWKNFQTGHGGAGISVLADQSNYGTEIAFYLSDADNTIEQRMVLISNGNVGVGITNPKYKLSVDGTISAKEVKVSTTPNSDYIFEPDYELKPLHEVDQFIQQNKHLPDIPSAVEFKENGVGLGEMDNMLLRKVEELTLYLIELKKENDQLKEVLKIQGIKTE